ncbi:hypothetical protein PI124_g15462 [Phytophthora idaei]|nr:hypothetical protein PI125_g15427 [Phytophthora idaei]KAG3142850.1 hypothetical protein PI126_g14862 [Phytophthora idaei]KAG3239603.1 hypothetical protein PI124_g15462 [Phytophthora idaei]
MRLLYAQLKTEDRFVVCSSLGTVGKSNDEGDNRANIELFFLYSWTDDEYIAAITSQEFYEKVALKFDATSSTGVNEDEDEAEEELTGDAAKKHVVYLKFYYAGGSCRFMFQYSTAAVKRTLENGVECVGNKIWPGQILWWRFSH